MDKHLLDRHDGGREGPEDVADAFVDRRQSGLERLATGADRARLNEPDDPAAAIDDAVTGDIQPGIEADDPLPGDRSVGLAAGRRAGGRGRGRKWGRQRHQGRLPASRRAPQGQLSVGGLPSNCGQPP